MDKGATCGTRANTNPLHSPSCCGKKYINSSYNADAAHSFSSKGYGVSVQAPFSKFGGDVYTDLGKLKYAQPKTTSHSLMFNATMDRYAKTMFVL